MKPALKCVKCGVLRNWSWQISREGLCVDCLGMLEPKRFRNFYLVVYKHLTKTRGWDDGKARAWLMTRPWRVVLRANNFIVRRRILAHPPAELREVMLGGRPGVALMSGSSVVRR